MNDFATSQNQIPVENLFVVLVNWNLKSDTIDCVDSILSAGVNPENIILIDNGSNDGSKEAIEIKYSSRIRLINNPQNLGYALAINQGIQQALSLNADWVFLLNNDAVVAPDILDRLSKTIHLSPQYLIFSPIIFFHAEPSRIWFFGDRLIPGTLLTYDQYRNKGIKPNLPDTVPVDFGNGCGLLVNSQVFKKIGLFDSRLIMYGEEVDFCWRARLAGFQIATATKAHMWHKVSTSANRDKPRYRYLKIRNQIIFYRRYSSFFQLPLMFTYSTLRSTWLIMSELLNSRNKLIQPVYSAWLDGWFKRLETEQ